MQNNLRGLHFSHILKPNFKKKFNPHELGMKSFIKIASGQKALLKKERKKKKQKNKKPDSNGIVSQLNSSMLTLPPSMKRCWAAECQAMLRKKWVSSAYKFNSIKQVFIECLPWAQQCFRHPGRNKGSKNSYYPEGICNFVESFSWKTICCWMSQKYTWF